MDTDFYNISFLHEPILISEQTWPEGTAPLVSISSLVYNHVNYIEECISHLLLQKTTFPVEIIFHDDASNDGTTKIIQSYVEKYPKLIKIVLQHENIYYNNIQKIENDLHNQRRGKYIANCEGDDFWIDSLKLQKQVLFLEANPDYAGAHSKVQYINKQGVVKGESNKVTDTLFDASYKDIVLNSMIHSASFIYRKDVLKLSNEYIWNLTPHYYDQYLFLVTALHGKIKYFDSPMAAYRINVGVLNSWNRFTKALYAEECVGFFLKQLLNKENRLASLLKMKSVYAILFCCYAKTNDALAIVYLRKYLSCIKSLYKLMPLISYVKTCFSIEFTLARGLFWYSIIKLSGGKIKPKGDT